jgi:glycosyltransferase involved in cell wall biosynthesis
MTRVLVVGQTPPPYHGQAIMIGELLRLRDPRLELIHVRMEFSEEMGEIGRFRPRKLARLVSLIARIGWTRLRSGANVLYYPPAGPDLVPVLRDMAVLVSVRWMFRRSIFHFHAGGLSQIYPQLPGPLRALFRLAYRRPDAAIRLSELNPEDGKFLGSRSEHVVPYGIEDPGQTVPAPTRDPQAPPRILFVAMIRETKGILVLLQACGILARRGLSFSLDVMGGFQSPAFETRVRQVAEEEGLGDRVHFLGVRTGADKFRSYAAADLFCFPTFFEAETFGVVLLEAMAFSLPIVATRWRGVPSLVKDGENGYLVPIQDSAALAARLEPLLRDPELRATMGQRGRQMFAAHYGLEQYHQALASVFLDES